MMKIKVINIFIFLLTIHTPAALAQTVSETGNEFHTGGLTFLEEGKIAEAETLFCFSAEEYSFAPSYYELAKIELDKNTVYSRRKARDYIQEAIWKDPRNIDYRRLKAKLMEYFSSSMAYDVYEEILDIDPDNTDALFNMGRISADQFYEYHNSFMKYESGPALSYNDFAYKDYSKAERFFNRAIASDPDRTDSYLHLSLMYSEAGEYDKGIPLLEKVIRIDSLNKDAWLFLGYLYYKTLDYNNCQSAYKKAMDLMTEDERNEFQLSTTMMLIGDDEVDQDEADKIVYDFWNSRDPLYLTGYNERLLEHYSRVAYSDLMFSVVKQKVEGWKSDRGEIMVRYGEPLSRIRFRPFINAGGQTQIMLKTDLWTYRNKAFGFTDDYWTGNFRFSTPSYSGRYFSQYQFDTYSYVKNLRRTNPEDYEPEFKGPVFTVPYLVTQFKDLNNDENRSTQLYLNYALDVSHSSELGNQYTVPHQAGLFLFDGSNKIVQKIENYTYLGNEKELDVDRYNRYWINSLEAETEADTVLMAFEIVRNKDGGVSANHFNFGVKDFNKKNLNISDIVVAAGIEKQSTGRYPLTRNNIGILPNPTQTFTRGTDIFLYYEVYNLKQDEDQNARFEQKITVKKIDESSFIENLFSSITSLFGSKHEDEITLTTDYQSFEKNTQVYLQLDMNGYTSGDYIITLTIYDKLAGSETSSETLIRWRL